MALTKINGDVIEANAISSTHLASGAVTHSSLSSITTDNVSEGSTNLYHSAARARSALSVTGGYLSYDSGTGVLQLTSDSIRGAITAGTGITYSAGQISIGQDVSTTATPTFGNITTTGYIAGPATFTIDPAAVGDNTGTVVIAGNLQVDGTTTTINSTTLTVDDKLVTLASGSINAAAADGAGIEVEISGATNPSITYDGTNDEWDFNKAVNINGGVGAYNFAATNSITIDNSSGYGAMELGGTSGAYIDLKSPSSDDYDLRIITFNTGGQIIAATGSPLLLASSGNSNQLYLDSSGNVGVGASTINEKLEVKGAIGFQATNSTNRWAAYTYTDNTFRLNYNGVGADEITIDSSGNVGIGTTPSTTIRNDITSAEKALQIGNRAMFFSDGGVTTDLQNNSHLTNSDSRVAMETDLGSLYQQYQGVHKWFNAASVSAGATQTMTERMRIGSTGKVGIGTNSLTSGLTVSDDTVGGDADMRRITIKSATHGVNSGFRFDSESANGTARASGYYFQPGDTNATTYLGLSSDDASYQMVINRDGAVGIGTDSPTGKLHVSGGRMGVISSNTHASWGHFRIGNTNDNEISMAYVTGATESDFLGDNEPTCAYKVVTGINAYGAGTRAFAIGNDYLANYHTMWTKEGHQLPRANNTYDLGSTTQGWRNIYTNDLNLSNLPPEGIDTEGNPYTREGNEVDGTNGSWTIQEGADDLFLINRVNGKKYKFNLTEITE